jgi:hypothetical protein
MSLPIDNASSREGDNRPSEPPKRDPQPAWQKFCTLLQGLAALVTLIGVGVEIYVYLRHALSN